MITPNSRVRKEGKEKGVCEGGVGRNMREGGEEIADYGEMLQPSQQHITPCVKGVEWGLGTRGF